uniref:RING-type E3 ubiquitin transferase n=1 Tax=Ursus americanus TaxID=9643 RepID=A0A452RWZ7_URSAM
MPVTTLYKLCSHNSSFSFTILNSFSLSSEDVLSKDAGECAICLEELQQGDTIARLPCLCIYHKGRWYQLHRVVRRFKMS